MSVSTVVLKRSGTHHRNVVVFFLFFLSSLCVSYFLLGLFLLMTTQTYTCMTSIYGLGGATRRESMREERAGSLLRDTKKIKARTIAGRGGKSLPCDPGSELRLPEGERKEGRR